MSRLFRVVWALPVLAGLAACSLTPEWAGGDPGRFMDLDGDHSFQAEVAVGDPLALEFRSPETGGYEITGTYFDATLLDMTSLLVLPGDGGPDRLEYVFTPKAPGQAMIEIRVRALGIPDAPIEVYKRVLVTIPE